MLSDCERCMNELTTERRYVLGCGYLPPAPPQLAPFVRPWQGLGYNGPRPTTCPGYTTQLPVVIELVRAHRHWAKGQLEAFCGTRAVPEAVLLGVEQFESAVGDFEAWRLTPSSRGGGAEG